MGSKRRVPGGGSSAGAGSSAGEAPAGWGEGGEVPKLKNPGGANLGYGAARSTLPAHRQAHDLPTRAWWKQSEDQLRLSKAWAEP
eukprot:scaffold90519_cov18-Tisochrysis_lutea.AAC.2